MKKPSAAQEKSGTKTGCSDTDFVKRYPTLAMYLADGAWEDGSSRETSTLTITVQDGVMRLALNDRDQKQSMYSSAGSVPEALKLLEAAVQTGQGEWRLWNAGRPKKKP